MEGSEGEEEAGGQEGELWREEKENALEKKRERESARRREKRKGWLVWYKGGGGVSV